MWFFFFIKVILTMQQQSLLSVLCERGAFIFYHISRNLWCLLFQVFFSFYYSSSWKNNLSFFFEEAALKKWKLKRSNFHLLSKTSLSHARMGLNWVQKYLSNADVFQEKRIYDISYTLEWNEIVLFVRSTNFISHFSFSR